MAKIDVDREAVWWISIPSANDSRRRDVQRREGIAEFFETWPADSDAPTDRLFGGSLEEIEKAAGYNPDDAGPWSWNLRAGLFEKDVEWSELLDLLRERGPVSD